jgi:hypothetical protein
MTTKETENALRNAGVTVRRVNTRRRPNGWHLYTATVTPSIGAYGWGDTPADARRKLVQQATRED